MKEEIFVQFGCPDSTDHDIIVVCPPHILPHQYKFNLKYIQNKLENKSKHIDINVISIENRKVKNVFKGSIEFTHAILFYTQHLHPNDFSLLLDQPKSLDIKTLIVYTIKYIFNCVEKLTGTEYYLQYIRPEKVLIYDKNDHEKFEFVKKLLSIIQDKQYLTEENKETYKTLIFKMAQILILHKQPEINQHFFIKREIIKSIKILYNENIANIVEFHLYRRQKFDNQNIEDLFNIFLSITKDRIIIST